MLLCTREAQAELEVDLAGLRGSLADLRASVEARGCLPAPEALGDSGAAVVEDPTAQLRGVGWEIG